MGEREEWRAWDGGVYAHARCEGSRELAGMDDANGFDGSVAATRGCALDGADDGGAARLVDGVGAAVGRKKCAHKRS